MPAPSLIEKKQIKRAFELAYFIVPDKSIALRVVEEAWCSLDLTLGKQDRTRKAYAQLLGYLKAEERSRPLRTKIRLSHEQMLQWLIYAHSDSWERATEYGDRLYSPHSEDLVVRYVKHLVQITSHRNSFYVALGVTRLLYEYGTHEVRLIYDVLTASDSARMKDMKYLRKQKARLMDELLIRFEGMIQTVNTAHGEKRFESQAISEHLIGLVDECLRRFTPWDTICTIQEGFDPITVPGLYFSGTDLADEDRIETSRIHTILHPDCFARFVKGLSQFVGRLPFDSPDKNCKFGSPEEFLAVPRFKGFLDGNPPNNRIDLPELEPADYLRLQRSKEALASRRKAHRPHRLSISVDDIERAFFDPRRITRVEFDIDARENVIEVLGEDAQGTLPMAVLIVCCEEIPARGFFEDSIVLEAGQKVTIQLHPIKSENGIVERASVAVSYAETRPLRAIFWYAQRTRLQFAEIIRHRQGSKIVRPDYALLGKLAMVLILMVAAVTLIWFQLRPPNSEVPSQLSGGPPPVPKIEPGPSAPAPLAPTPPVQKEDLSLIANATWSRNPESARRAIRLETERGGITKIEIPSLQRSFLIALPGTDSEGVAYTHYRATLVAADKRIWQQTLRAPLARTSPAHVLNVLLSSQQEITAEPLVLRFDGKTRSGWQSLGEVTLQFVGP